MVRNCMRAGGKKTHQADKGTRRHRDKGTRRRALTAAPHPDRIWPSSPRGQDRQVKRIDLLRTWRSCAIRALTLYRAEKKGVARQRRGGSRVGLRASVPPCFNFFPGLTRTASAGFGPAGPGRRLRRLVGWAAACRRHRIGRPGAFEVLLDLGLFDQVDQGLDLADGFDAAPHQDPVHVPVAPLERAVLQVVDRLAEDQRAGDERAVDERLTADVHGLVLERLALVFRQQHGGRSSIGRESRASRSGAPWPRRIMHRPVRSVNSQGETSSAPVRAIACKVPRA